MINLRYLFEDWMSGWEEVSYNLHNWLEVINGSEDPDFFFYTMSVFSWHIPEMMWFAGQRWGVVLDDPLYNSLLRHTELMDELEEKTQGNDWWAEEEAELRKRLAGDDLTWHDYMLKQAILNYEAQNND